MGALGWVGAAFSMVSSILQDRQERKSLDMQQRLADQQAAMQKDAQNNADQAQRKQNQNQADVSGLLGANTNGGLGSTSLTGATGAQVDPNRLSAGNRLLGA